MEAEDLDDWISSLLSSTASDGSRCIVTWNVNEFALSGMRVAVARRLHQLGSTEGHRRDQAGNIQIPSGNATAIRTPPKWDDRSNAERSAILRSVEMIIQTCVEQFPLHI
jgi:hypothetical protein